jgi:nicotinamidase-related amidase
MHTQRNLAIGKHDALIVVDIQNDFLPEGILAEPSNQCWIISIGR